MFNQNTGNQFYIRQNFGEKQGRTRGSLAKKDNVFA